MSQNDDDLGDFSVEEFLNACLAPKSSSSHLSNKESSAQGIIRDMPPFQFEPNLVRKSITLDVPAIEYMAFRQKAGTKKLSNPLFFARCMLAFVRELPGIMDLFADYMEEKDETTHLSEVEEKALLIHMQSEEKKKLRRRNDIRKSKKRKEERLKKERKAARLLKLEQKQQVRLAIQKEKERQHNLLQLAKAKLAKKILSVPQAKAIGLDNKRFNVYLKEDSMESKEIISKMVAEFDSSIVVNFTTKFPTWYYNMQKSGKNKKNI